MGENDSAAFDPIFFFHHSFIDLVFWSWQEYTRKKIEVIKDYPGTSSVDEQGPTPKMAADSTLDEHTPLYPFREDPAEDYGNYLTSVDVASTRRLGYTYDKLIPRKEHEKQKLVPTDSTCLPLEAAKMKSVPFVRVSGIDRSRVKGSFAISVWANDHLVGVEPVFSRWHVGGCVNCQNSLHVTSHMPIPPQVATEVNKAKRADFAIKMLLSDEATIDKTQKDIGDLPIAQQPRLDVGELGMLV